MPTDRHRTTAQVVNLHEKLFMIDCGEGTQNPLRQAGLMQQRLSHVFISHLHGDHCFGLLPLLSTYSLQGRHDDMHLYMPSEMLTPFMPVLENFCHVTYRVVFHPLDSQSRELIYEDKDITVESIPLKHKVPCCGFVFREKKKANRLLPEETKKYGIPVTALKDIKNGKDYVMADGTIVKNEWLTAPNEEVPRSYAFCSDTAFSPEVVEAVRGTDVLYHEATYSAKDAEQAREFGHSTAHEAATVAKMAGVKRLVIGHCSIRYDEQALLEEAQEVFADTILAQDDAVIDI